MSKIDDQIKTLLLKKKKIDYLSYVADLIKNDTKCHDFKDVKNDVVSKIEPFLLTLMESIEKDEEVKSYQNDTSSFSEEQKNALVLLANKTLNMVSPNKQTSTEVQAPKPQKKQDSSSTHDKMNFAINNRHLGNKRVQVLNDKNAAIYGTVVGLDAPFVLVKTETGPTIQVPIEKVVPQ